MLSFSLQDVPTKQMLGLGLRDSHGEGNTVQLWGLYLLSNLELACKDALVLWQRTVRE
jgi:hypothetical protein